MKKGLILLSTGLLVLFAAGAALAYDSIGAIHVNDANGNPVAPYAVGTAVSIRGIITAEFTTATVTYTRAFIQDETGGINIYKSGEHICFSPGEDVTIEGTIAQYQGLTEVLITSYVINGCGCPLPAPKVITVSQLNGTFLPDYTEPDEGKLIRINCVTIPGATGNWSSKSWTITDVTGSGTLYVYGGSCCAVHSLIGTPVPVGPFNVVGILTQYDSSDPRTAGYQISPRGLCDIEVPGTPVESATWGRIKTLFD
ncbi:MAG: hypothetical protein JW952_03535 [Candidatus Eisenbacteria bacterium]|nr:hypothetical protein [Candidatus Eisenbacteria bacterium]